VAVSSGVSSLNNQVFQVCSKNPGPWTPYPTEIAVEGLSGMFCLEDIWKIARVRTLTFKVKTLSKCRLENFSVIGLKALIATFWVFAIIFICCTALIVALR
jgi:hypothetical protein